MLAKKYRLTKQRDFDQVFKKTRSIFSENLSIRSLRSNQEVTTFGFIISNKIDKRSTRRNALKRQLRTIVGMRDDIVGGFKIIISVKKDFIYPYDQKKIKDQVDYLLKKSGVIKSKEHENA